MSTIKELLSWSSDYLKGSGVKGHRLDAEVILRYILNLDDVGLIQNYDLVPSSEKVSLLGKMLSERAGGKPVAYLTGHKEFMGLDFRVNESVLIPRPETELLVERPLEELGNEGKKLIIDLGTGSAAIAVSLAKLGGHRVHAVDVSPGALEVGRENARRHGVEEMVDFHLGNLFEPLRDLDLLGKVDAVVSNPPYIPTGELEKLQIEIKDHEPHIALDGGLEGTDYHRRIIVASREFLKAGGILVLELGYCQAEAVCRMIERSGAFSQPEVKKDYSGIERVVVARVNG